jgi:regulator of Ty1 transposition protein 103
MSYLCCIDLDKARDTAAKAGLGGSIFASASSLPVELAPLATPQQNVSKLLLSTKTAVKSANTDYDKLMGSGNTVPSAPVYAARLSGLLKTLAQAEGAVEQCVKARRELVSELQKLLDTNRNALIADEDELENVMQKKIKVEEKKTDVENALMAGLPNDEPYTTGNGQSEQPTAELDRPEIEALTPPSNDDDEFEPEPSSAPEWSPEFPPETTFPSHPAPVSQVLPPTGSAYRSPEVAYKSVTTSANGSKKRRLDNGSDFPDLGGDFGIDAEVAEILRKDSGSN